GLRWPGTRYITEQLTNENSSGTPWREGTYSLSGSTGDYAVSVMDCYNLCIGGQVIISDEDHHVVVPFSSNVPTLVAHTANARGACDWQFCKGLPPFY